MICYRDMTFCSSDCQSYKCERMLSNSQAKEAERFSLPICFSDFSKDCKDYEPKDQNPELLTRP